MPQSYPYTSIISLISTPRLGSYQVTFKPKNDSELYGIYTWAQHAAGSLYPLTQNVEITLRNAIDNEAKSRFGDFWWRLPCFNRPPATNLFQDNIGKAIRKLASDWEKKERKRLRLRSRERITTPVPVWTHDQIVSATDFSTWQFIMDDAFNAPPGANRADYLWPLSMNKVFKNYSVINVSSAAARQELRSLIRELREYRNRLFHHEPIWTKEPSVVDARTAIDTIRKKINRLELLIEAIDPRKVRILHMVGAFASARRICSESELNIYRYCHDEPSMTRRKKRTLRSLSLHAKKNNLTAAWSYGGSVYGIFQIR